MTTHSVRIMAEVALFATLSYLLDVFTQPMSLGPWVSVSFKMVPVFLLSFRWGTKAGLLAGFIWGVLQVVTGQATGGFLNLIQGFLEYFIAFALIGLAGLVMPVIQKAIKSEEKIKTTSYILLGLLIGSLSRYFIHFMAGIIFWGSYAPEGQSALLYSLTINGLSWLGEFTACLLVFLILLNFLPRLLKR